MQNKKNIKTITSLYFPPNVAGTGIVCKLAKSFQLEFNILKAEISPRQEGVMVLEIFGQKEDFDAGMEYLKTQNIVITPISQKIFHDADICMHCGMCTALCPTNALSIDKKAPYSLIFLVDKCTTCGLCTKTCPVSAINLDITEESN